MVQKKFKMPCVAVSPEGGVAFWRWGASCPDCQRSYERAYGVTVIYNTEVEPDYFTVYDGCGNL